MPPPEDEAHKRAREQAALAVTGIIDPVLSLTRVMMMDEFKQLDRHQVESFIDRLRAVIITGRDPRDVDPNARINFGDVQLQHLIKLVEGKADDRLEREDRGLPTD